MSDEPVWLSYADALEICTAVAELYPHQLLDLTKRAELAAALDRPKYHYFYLGKRDLFLLASEYVYSVGKAHTLTDGNKRVAFQCALIFLHFNGYRLMEPVDEFFAIYIKALMADRINREMLAAVFSTFSMPL